MEDWEGTRPASLNRTDGSATNRRSDVNGWMAVSRRQTFIGMEIYANFGLRRCANNRSRAVRHERKYQTPATNAERGRVAHTRLSGETTT